ncbi:hypothetical protein H310_13864 [Aphanomyces invadans]|uniref:Uncharacterized protein n=1 Tax=Aphanomyces invadans TaxID=157072 RepID=A0A024TC79_9STRA|nr:hypothetical protein H310_13864 [Aphanomyces invadans]ETV91614.1 hypothetical protein H310_13864 [Aphanomyces invadans]|eukprot:XP_008879733.1 hypothetical protein H310_13864 [Aphanomyces invadans]
MGVADVRRRLRRVPALRPVNERATGHCWPRHGRDHRPGRVPHGRVRRDGMVRQVDADKRAPRQHGRDCGLGHVEHQAVAHFDRRRVVRRRGRHQHRDHVVAGRRSVQNHSVCVLGGAGLHRPSCTRGLTWWNQGRESKKVVSLTWDTGHVVANATELISIQVLLSLLAMGLISSDFYLTVQGLRGFLQQKPVMTYDLLAGLERRKLLLIVVTLAALPSLLYADVARIYRGTANGDLIWSLSIVLVGMFFTFATLVVLVAVQHVPSPWPCCLVSFSPGVFSYSTIVSLIVVWHSRYESVAIGFNDAPMQLGMNFSGVVRPTGAYSADGAETVVAHNLAGTATAVAVCLAVSVAYSTLVRVSMTGRVFLHTSWTSTNGFLNQCRLPRWITGLPLDQTNAIKIGNKLFCKPSTQAVLGFAVVVDVAADRYHVQSDQSAKTASFSKHTLTLIPVYWLVPTLARVFAVVPPWMTPRIFGTIDKNMFAHSSRDKHLDHRTYVHCRGACVN